MNEKNKQIKTEDNSGIKPNDQLESILNHYAFSHKRVVDLLDIQLLLAVIVFFVSAWAYFNSLICDFTMTEPHDERMSYIVVHYLLTIMLILCIGITHIKGKYLLKTDRDNFSMRERRYIDLFIDSWLIVLILCVLILSLNSIIPWWLGLVFFVFGVIAYMIINKFGVWETILVPIMVFLFFPLFISLMTNISKDIEINVSYDKEIESLYIEVDAKSYDCRYFVKGITDEELRLGKDYFINGPVIRINKAYLRNNMVTVSTISPASGSEFLKYPLKKIMNVENTFVMPKNASVYNKTAIITLK